MPDRSTHCNRFVAVGPDLQVVCFGTEKARMQMASTSSGGRGSLKIYEQIEDSRAAHVREQLAE